MHTALCAYDDHATAERVRDELVRAGFARHDVHLQHPGSDLDSGSRQDALRSSGGVEHEIALDPHVVRRVTGFFGHLFGEDDTAHRSRWDSHVDTGRTVVVVDAHDEGEAERARTLMHGLQGTDANVVHRPARRPVRDIVANTPMAADTPLSTQPMVQTRGTGLPERASTARADDRAMAADAAMGDRVMPTAAGNRATAAGDERAMAAGTDPRSIATGEPRAADLGTRDTENDKVGLRYADKDDADRPSTTRDGLGRTRKDE